MGKGIRANAHKHKRTKRRERAEGHYDKKLEERAAIAAKHLENVRLGKLREDRERERERERERKEIESRFATKRKTKRFLRFLFYHIHHG